ncbi:hypothetical protein J2W83_001005 [Pseudomonas hunanensis]|uniref:Uncharacterized protein n=1 Tax=Pseudomonas hunanensis TaxID=1247546 RepID=A0ACC6JYY5_9PSED|nr:hypothetical protein [Pseudomonas hunanensis]MDR6711411.1 hypothetical protein [Pseudomonas hunanensis]
MELFIVEEHTETYLTLQAGGDFDRGLLTGVLGGTVGCASVGLTVMLGMQGIFDPIMLALGLCFFVVPFLWETLRPLPLPILFNRRTREVYFDHDGELFHSPWDGIVAIANEFQLVGAQIGAMRNASLEIRVWKFKQPETALVVKLGAPFGKTLAMQKGFWEYIRAYMNNGPYFDEYGNHSESDEFVKSQLAVRFKMSECFKNTLARIRQKKKEAGGKNYLGADDFALLIIEPMFYPLGIIQEFTYSVAKRRSRNRWPSLVIERLKANGPTTRLVDLELEAAEAGAKSNTACESKEST